MHSIYHTFLSYPYYIPYFYSTGHADTLIWTLKGNQGQAWQNAQAPIRVTFASYQMVFEGKRGNSYQGDIAIDDISFTNGLCGGKCKTFSSSGREYYS